MATIQAPEKPYPDFPLFAHARGRWAKKIAGKTHYFGPWKDPAKALENYVAHRDKAPVSEVREQAPKVSAKDRPAKPHKDFPLFAHDTKQWAKKIRGQTRYFGHWDDPQAALETYLAEKDDLLAGRTPQARRGDATIADLVKRFKANKKGLLDSGELAPRSYGDYERECDRVTSFFGANRPVVCLSSQDFEELRKDMAKTLGPVALGNAINRVRILFKFAADEKIIPSSVHFGQSFDRPSAKTLRKERQKKGKRFFEAKQIVAMLDKATKAMKAMILLGINAGFGNSDCATLPLDALDLQGGWLDYARPKTGVYRRCKLWPETVAALRDVLAVRREPKDRGHAKLVFITRTGDAWSSDIAAITKECDKILHELNFKRAGLAFYALRHTFQTIGEKSRDAPAVRFIMGHVPASNDMSAVYREEIDDERLQAVADSVRGWLLGSAASASAA
jgi:integrase